jgi:Uma2 family endonuclease
MADNTRQMRWIVVLYGNLAAQYRAQLDVFVAGDLFWYPVQGHPEIVVAPDVLVVFGRPKGDRGSYRQWEEGNVPVTVAFEVLSPNNTVTEMADKLVFYEEHGVEEYYVYDPDRNRLLIYLRRRSVLQFQHDVQNFVSPRLGIRFDVSGPEMVVVGPDGQPFLTFEDLQAERQRDQQSRLAAEQRAGQAEQRAGQAEQRAVQAEQRAVQAEQRARRIAELGRKARHEQASAEELAELERLEQLEPPG